MRKIEKRAFVCLVLAGLLLLGMTFFVGEFLVKGGSWASSAFNRHLYNNEGVLTSGTVLDRDGDTLSAVDENGNRIYYQNATVRKATLHAVGDAGGNIATGARLKFRARLCGFSPLTGTTAGGHNAYLTIDSKLNTAACTPIGRSATGSNGRRSITRTATRPE